MSSRRPISIAILAMGGEGGNVLSDWIVSLAERNGYLAQSTSVPGVAQRTGATVYYVELFPEAEAQRAGREPVFALMPVPGDVDIVLASELMEAGRAIQRGLVTPERTLLVASTHRVYSIAEKSAMSNGMVDGKVFVEAGLHAARRFVRFDMATLAQESGSLIGAVLFGALAGAQALPFARAQFEDTIRRAGVGVQASLVAFAAGFERASSEASATEDSPPPAVSTKASPPGSQALLDRLHAQFPARLHQVLQHALARLIDYQDADYASLYLDRVAEIVRREPADGNADYRLSESVARCLALWMSYEDTARVADLKIRSGRFARIREEADLRAGQVLHVHDFFRPRVQEVADTLPRFFGRYLLRSKAASRVVAALVGKGRTVQTTSLSGFLLLRAVAAMRKWRRASLRYEVEQAQIESWLETIGRLAGENYDLAIEIAECQGLVRGYSDTRERGTENFRAVMQALQRVQHRPDAARRLRALRQAAQADEHGIALQAALRELAAV